MVNENTVSPAYEQRFFAFVDILGFSEIVQRTQGNKELFERLREILEFTAIDSFPESSLDTRRWEMAFSDSIVISERNSLGDLLQLFINLSALTLNLLTMDAFVRGGIVLGPIYHRASLVFGPALIDAYKLERDVASYPRIVVSDDIIKRIDSPSGWTDESCAGNCLALLRRDFDGVYFVDFLGNWATRSWAPVDEALREGLQKIRSMVEKNLNDSSVADLRILAKLRWFVHYFNIIVQERKQLGIQAIELPRAKTKPLDHPLIQALDYLNNEQT